MNEGVAVVIAAVVGLGGAYIGGSWTARGARIGAETAARATAEQVQDQAKVDHENWLRERRLEACQDLLSAYNDYAEAATTYAELLDAAPDGSTPVVTLPPSMMALSRSAFLIRILGPDELWHAAERVRQTQGDHAESLYAYRRAFEDGDDLGMTDSRRQQAPRKEQMTVAYGVFVRAANEAVVDSVRPSGSVAQLN
ncbi:hypothetical protein [Streptomyces sp. NPDC058572]|uniref:hypothetical protein n=1 Tax=Streptomyces sp. NPDC058572 TaxID=3346546 RepID=UPI003667FC8E